MCSGAIIALLDPYLDAHLSGALEQLNASEMTAVNTLATMGILQHSAALNSSSKEIGDVYSAAAGDHTYCQMINASDKMLIDPVQSETRSLCEIITDEAGPNSVEPYNCEVDMNTHDILNNPDYYLTSTVLEGESILGINPYRIPYQSVY